MIGRLLMMVLVWLTGVGAALAGGAQASTDGSIRGYVRDEQHAVLPGAIIVASSVATGARYDAATDERGYYRLVNLPPGPYTMTVDLAGLAPYVREDLAIRAGVNLALDIVMAVGGLSDAIQVHAETPLIETKSAVQAVNVSGELQRSLPLSSRRNWADALILTPGVVSHETGGQQWFFLHGSDFDEHVLQIDGADMAATMQATTSYIDLGTDAIEDVQIKIAAMDASAPLTQGAVLNVTTRSGSNRLTGSALLAYQSRQWFDRNLVGGTIASSDLMQPDVSVGAPLVRDRWWVFGSYRYNAVDAGVSRRADQVAAIQALAPGAVLRDNTDRGPTVFVKSSVRLSSQQQVSGFYQRNMLWSDLFTAGAGQQPNRRSNGGNGASAKLSSVWGRSLTSQIGIAFNDKALGSGLADTSDPIRRVYQQTLSSGGRLSGVGELASIGAASTTRNQNPSRKLTLSADFTWFTAGRSGRHELQTGVLLQPWISQRTHTSYINGGFAVENTVLREPGNLNGGYVPFHRQIYDVTELTTRSIDTQDYAVYVQDAWKPLSRLTLTAGVRVDRITHVDSLVDVTVQQSTEVGPRLGFNYALTADGRHTLRGSFGRVHESPSKTATTAGGSTAGYRDLYDLDLDGVFETVFVTPGATALTTNRFIDPEYHAPYTHEWTLGYRRQFPGAIVVDASFTHRTWYDRVARVEVNGIYDGQVFRGYRNEAQNEIFLQTNNVWNQPVFSGLDLSVTKQTRGVQLLASYARQWRHLDGTWQPADPAGFIQPSAFANDRGIGNPGYTPTDYNSLMTSSGTQVNGPTSQWQDHVVRLGATVTAPWGLMLATNYTFQSGPWSGPVFRQLPAGDPQFGPATVTLSNGRVVSNPLATPLRFAFGTRGEGQFTLPNYHVLNARIGKRFAWGTRRIEGGLDLFNLTNNGTDLSIASSLISDPLFGLGRTRQAPRAAQVSIRVAF